MDREYRYLATYQIEDALRMILIFSTLGEEE